MHGSVTPPFSQHLLSLDIQQSVSRSLLSTRADVERVLAKDRYDLKDLPVLLSPASDHYLEEIAQKAHQLTVQRFGKIMQIFIPLYLSNECHNTCTYCGFSQHLKFERSTLSDEAIISEAKLLSERGFRHLLLLTGEAKKTVGTSFIAHAIELTAPYFDSIGIEVQPMEVDDYRLIRSKGCEWLTVYQETYEPKTYAAHHLFGKKRRFDYRLDTPERGAQAGFYQINLGVLLGLYDFRYEAIALASHLEFMQKKYWRSKYGVFFPCINSIHDPSIDLQINYPVSDPDFVKLICTFRLLFPDLAITLSTRESPWLRDRLFKLGISSMSAESNTAPGGYSGSNSMGQFDTVDHRSLSEIKEHLASEGYEAVMKDWEGTFPDRFQSVELC